MKHWIAFVVALTASSAAAADLSLWYRQPAARWEEALPVGNGRLGAMVFGGVERERIQLNEESVWSGRPRPSKASPKYAELMRLQRALIFAGKYVEAGALKLSDLPGGGGPEVEIPGTSSARHSYQTLGDLYILRNQGLSPAKEYRRELNLDTAVATVSYRIDGATYREEVFSSAPDQVLVIRLSCDRPGSISFVVSMDRPTDVRANQDRYATTSEFQMMEQMQAPPAARLRTLKPDWADWSGQASDDGAVFRGVLTLAPVKGQLISRPGALEVRNSDSVVLRFTAATDFRGADPARLAAARMRAALAQAPDAMLSRHLADYQSLFRRVSLDLGSTENTKLPTDVRLRAFQLDTEDNRAHYLERDPGLYALYFQFGRYLLISSSRPGGLPPALQGLWNDSLLPPWFGQHTSDINIEMNFWPAEVTNLTECHLPLLDLLETFEPAMRQAARTAYDARGLVLNGVTNYGPKTAGSTWQDAAGWLAQDYWEHYQFTGDRTFLSQHAWPFLKGAAEFYLDFLVEHPSRHWLVTGPTYSPENAFRTPEGKTASLSAGTTISLGVIRDLFGNTIAAAKALGIEPGFRARLEDTLTRLAPYQIGNRGQLQEWLEDFTEAEPGNRHESHLLPLFPGKSITPRATPDLTRAARIALQERLAAHGGWTGWSRAWLLNLSARLQDGALARDQLIYLLRRCTFTNLFDAHPRRNGNISIFQIDGNFGGTAGIAEMLLQSHTGEIELLPALPREWAAGQVRGLRARGAFEVDQQWSGGTLRLATVRSLAGGHCTLRYRGRLADFETTAGQVCQFNGNLEKQ